MAILVLSGAVFGGSQAAWIAGKALLAQRLLDTAWAHTLDTGEASRPWPWADIRPVARLVVQDAARSLIVLDNSSGEALAFGPGVVFGDPATRGALAIGGHRDTHLGFLATLQPGAALLLERASGERVRYVAGNGRVVDTRTETVAIDPARDALVLITCWPFDAALPGGPLRWVVTATPASAISHTADSADEPVQSRISPVREAVVGDPEPVAERAFV